MVANYIVVLLSLSYPFPYHPSPTLFCIAYSHLSSTLAYLLPSTSLTSTSLTSTSLTSTLLYLRLPYFHLPYLHLHLPYLHLPHLHLPYLYLSFLLPYLSAVHILVPSSLAARIDDKCSWLSCPRCQLCGKENGKCVVRSMVNSDDLHVCILVHKIIQVLY